MSIRDVDRVATALLYEGYLLYPYRPSALKNRQPFNFGVVGPGEEMQTECLVRGTAPGLDVRVRFLQVAPEAIEREVIAPAAFEWPPLTGMVEIATTRYSEDVLKLSVRLTNTSPRDSLVAAHTIMRVSDGEFASMIDPPEDLSGLATECHNIRTWPVLAGEPDQRHIMLSSPIIVYDYPEIAEESPGDLFDATEIDEILSLRILALSEHEQQEIREGDPKARLLLERTQALAAEQMMKLHGTMRKPT